MTLPWRDLHLILATTIALTAAARPSPAQVDITVVPHSPHWPDATEEGALSLACAPTAQELGEHFAREADRKSTR